MLKGKIFAVFSALLLMSSALSSSVFATESVDETKVFDEETGVYYNTQDDWLHVEDDKIYDMDGNEVWLTGCNWFGYNVGSQVFDGVWSQNMHDMLRQIADHGFNVLRVPMSTQILLQWKNNEPDPATPKVNVWSNPELTVEGVQGGECMYSFDIWNYAVKWCRQLGIKIFIDIHCASTHSAGHNFNMWYDDTYSTQDMNDALCWFADYYKNDDTIIGIDIKNEPHGTINEGDFAKWDGSTDDTNWQYVASTIGSNILDVNPNLLIFVEGIECYPKFEDGNDWNSPEIDYTTMYNYYHTTWWGANLRGAAEYPIDFGSDEKNAQLVYSPHDYGPLVYMQTWFYDGFNRQTLMDDCWRDNWAYLLEEDIAPILIGEWGGFIDDEHDADGKNRQWLSALREYIIEDHIHHTFWCFNENSSDTGGLIYDNFTTWDEEKYAFVEVALWQDDAGKFISLDHEVAVGANGISLGEYYSDSKTEAPIIYGDANGDGVVNSIDATIVTRAALNVLTLSEEVSLRCDVNGDGSINSIDATIIVRYALGVLTQFPVEK